MYIYVCNKAHKAELNLNHRDSALQTNFKNLFFWLFKNDIILHCNLYFQNT
jgi:hypothetical protein